MFRIYWSRVQKIPNLNGSGITAQPSTSENTMSNAELEQIHQVLGNLLQTCNITQSYIDEENPWLGILYSAAFVIGSTTERLKGYSTVQLIFGCDTIIPMKHTMDL